MFERFTDRSRRVLVLAQGEARLLKHIFIGTEHILLGLIHEGEGVAAKALEQLGISLVAVREKVEETIGLSGPAPTSPPFTPRAKKVIELSLREALQLGDNYIGTGHLLLGLIREDEAKGTQVLVELGVDLGSLREWVVENRSGQETEGLRSAARAQVTFAFPADNTEGLRSAARAQPTTLGQADDLDFLDVTHEELDRDAASMLGEQVKSAEMTPIEVRLLSQRIKDRVQAVRKTTMAALIAEYVQSTGMTNEEYNARYVDIWELSKATAIAEAPRADESTDNDGSTEGSD